jgi:dynein heavy chain
MLRRSTWLLNTVVSSGKPCLFVGESGTAKSVTIANYLAHLDAAVNIVLNVNFSSRTSSIDVQRAIEDSTEKRTKVWLFQPFPVALVACLAWQIAQWP